LSQQHHFNKTAVYSKN